MSYPVDPSEVYELRRRIELLEKEGEVNSAMLVEERRKRRAAEKCAKEYADANAKAIATTAKLYEQAERLADIIRDGA